MRGHNGKRLGEGQRFASGQKEEEEEEDKGPTRPASGSSGVSIGYRKRVEVRKNSGTREETLE